MGFSLSEIKAFLRVWEASNTAPEAMATVRAIFDEKLRETRTTIVRLTKLADELQESLAYLDSCKSCAPVHTQPECGKCEMHGHEGKAPLLVDGITKH